MNWQIRKDLQNRQINNQNLYIETNKHAKDGQKVFNKAHIQFFKRVRRY